MIPSRLPLAAALALLPPLAAQAPPGTDIYVAPLIRNGATLTVGPAANLTARAGYDNQPFFTPDGRGLYYTSQRDGQTDIYRYDFASRTATQVTRTAESEYSPTVMPDGRRLSVIRVERDSTQRLWAFTLEGTPVGPLLDTIKPVGYHTWLAPDTVFIFVLGSPATLRRAVVSRGTADVMASDIGRSLWPVPGRHAVSYLQHDSSGVWVRSLDPVTGVSEPLARLVEGSEFFAWTPAGELLSAAGNRVLRWRPGDTAWAEIARFGEPGLQKISRLAVSPSGDRIALVAEDSAPPL